MKTKLLLLLLPCLFAGAVCKAQFPAPHSFTLSVRYISMDESGVCDGHLVDATNCADFWWEAPDLSETGAQLMGYNIYYYAGEYHEGMEMPFGAEIIAQTTETYLQMIMYHDAGLIWVTAVYSNPEGESKSSNIEVHYGLALAIKGINTQDVSVIYNKQKDGIEIKGVESITSFSIFRLNGSEIPIPVISDFIDTKSMEKGIYIIKITTKNGEIISDKIIIN